ncbi:hypothetical protein FXO38_06524 [Capsicum annuum]|nr:hypothetical protein FXO38_06524 [Capsicum annuum]
MPASNDDTHQEIRDDTGYSHHQALNCRNAGIKGWYKEQIARESWIEVNREVADGTRKVIKVMKAAHEIGLSHSGNEPGDDDYSVSLDADTECPSDQMQKTKPLCLHEPVAFSDFHISKMDSGVQSDKRFTNFIFNKHDEPISNDSKEMTGV